MKNLIRWLAAFVLVLGAATYVPGRLAAAQACSCTATCPDGSSCSCSGSSCSCSCLFGDPRCSCHA